MEELVERRIVTVLFADLVGFTTLSEQFDPEDIAVIQDRYFAMVRETVARYGGRLEKFIGDAAMAVFGVPVARDDDAVRAVRAGLALIGGTQQIGATLGLDEDALRLRVGVNTGETVTAESGPDEGRVTGDTVNTAARLQTAAPAGGVLIGETTALAVAEIAELGDATHLELKGKAEPTKARLVTGLRAEPSREEAMGGLRAPTLGREAELDALLKSASNAAQGESARWLIVAPPGVGKSRLLRELADRLASSDHNARIWRSRARPDSVSPFDAIARLLIDALGTADRDEASARLSTALAASGVAEGRRKVVLDACLSVGWPSATSADATESGKPSDDRAALFAAWLDGLDALAARATQVWLVEDVHWAGGDVLAFLDAASERPARLLVATARPSLLEANAEWAAEDPDAGRHTTQLAPLAAADATALITTLVGEALPAELVERIADRSDGNCLFIEELLRTWVSVGTLARDVSGDWRLTVPTDEIPLPASVQSIYAAQLDDLPPDARRLARRASVAGRRFPVGALLPLGATADEGLEPLQRRELVVGPVTEPLWGLAFAYRHALLRDAGYASLARAERTRLHIRLAKWLEEAAGARSVEVAEQIAGHYAAALEAAPALAQELDDGLDRNAVSKLAADWYERAGQSTLQLSAHDAARTLLKKSIDLTTEDDDLEAARRWERLGDATAFAADMDAGAQAYEKAMELYRKAIDKGSAGFDAGSRVMNRAAEAMARRAALLESISPEGAKALAAGAEEVRAGSEGIQAGKREFQEAMLAARTGLARTAASLSDVRYNQLRFDDARDLAAQVQSEVDAEDAASQARLLMAHARGSLGGHGPSAEAEAEMERALELARSSGDRRLEVNALHTLTVLQAESGREDPDAWRAVAAQAREAGDQQLATRAAINGSMVDLEDRAELVSAQLVPAREAAAAHGLTEDGGWIDYVEAEGAFVRGEWDVALDVGRRVLDLGEKNNYLRLTVRTIHVLVPIAGVRGDVAILERAARWYRSLEGKFEFPDSPYSRVIRAAQDVELAAHGLWPAYVPDVEERIASFDDPGGGPSWCAALDRVMRSWLDAGEIDGAGRALDHMGESIHGRDNISSLGMGTYALMRGRLAQAKAEATEASASATQALARFRESKAPWWMAKAIRLLERCGAADGPLIKEVQHIERALGAIEPTR